MQKLAKREEQIMQACWHLGKAFIKEIIAELPDPKAALQLCGDDGAHPGGEGLFES